MAYDDVTKRDEDQVCSDSELDPLVTSYELNNWPWGPNCYDASQLDYKCQEVNADNFLSVLKGDEDRASGPVLESDENSIIFIFYSGQGQDDGS